MPAQALTRQRLHALRAALPETVDLLHRRRAAQIPPDHVDDYVALDWLKWDGGTLRLTITGANIHRQMLDLVDA
ncbi:hypothetical protein AACH06_24450 [Ideonella sp. DXS29W]|uniref:Uncharacterized protein n=1 Tax=Ideonella lacteola TaxID=2984193 RepID=A0ABU9BY02_9BURK